MMNEEKRDRMLSETLDQCLSGIDSLPSQRAEIAKRMTGAPAGTGRIAFRAIALPAALTLLLCAGIGVFSGLQGRQPYPDPLKTDTTLVAEKPLPTDFVPLAQPEGGEDPADTVVIENGSVTWDQWGAVVPTVEPEPEATVQAVWFFSRWRDHKWADLLEMCSQEWRDRQADPAAALADLAAFMTPDTLEMDAITSIEKTEDAGYIMAFTVSDREKPETQYMISLNVKKENGGLWYINPDSLKEYTVLSPRLLPETAEKDLTEEERFRRALREANPELAEHLVPVGMSCESSGVKLEVISAAISEQDALIVYTLEDLEGGRFVGDPNLYPLSMAMDFYPRPIIDRADILYWHAEPESDRITAVTYCCFDQPADPADLNPMISMTMANPKTLHELELDLIPLLREYGGHSRALTSPPEETGGHIQKIAEDKEYSDSEIRDLDIKVLDPAGSLEIPLNEYTFLSGIDLDKNGILHLQLRYPECNGIFFPTIKSASGIIQEEDFVQPDRPSHLYWGKSGLWMEMQIKLNGEIRDDASLIVEAGCLWPVLTGDWQIKIPTEQIWVSIADSNDPAETPAAEEETAEARIIPYANARLLKCIQLWRAEDWPGLLDLCVPSWKEQAAEPLEPLKGLFPFGKPEIVDSTPLKSGETEYTADCILRSRSDRETWYRVAITMRKETDGLWYLDPESLRDCKAMTVEEILEFRTVRAENHRDYSFGGSIIDDSDPSSFLRSAYPSLADSLVPVGLTCDSNDIRLEIVSAAVKGKEALVIFSLQDLAADRLSRSFWNYWTSVTLHHSFSGSYLYDLGWDPVEKALLYALYVPDGKLFDPDQSFLDFRLPGELRMSHVTYTDLLPLLREYGSQAGELIDPPEDLSGVPCPPDYVRTTADLFLEQNGKVLDFSHPLDIPLSEHVFLSGIGLKEDGMIHVQLHAKNISPVMELMDVPVGNITGLQVISSVDTPAFSPISWSGGEPEFNGFAEYLFPWDPDQGETTTLTAGIGEIGDTVSGTWEIRIPLEDIRVTEE